MNKPKRTYSMQRRAASAEATRASIRDAAIGLHAERLWDDFTLQEVAQRAGTTVQTVLRAYGSKDALELLAMEASAVPRRKACPPGDTAAAVRVLYDDYEAVGDRVVRYLAEELRRPALASRVELGRRAHRAWVRTVFAPELEGRPKRAAQDLLRALVVATDVYVWKLLRRDMHLDRASAERVVRGMIAAIAHGGAHGEVPVGVLGRRRKPAAKPRDRARPSQARA